MLLYVFVHTYIYKLIPSSVTIPQIHRFRLASNKLHNYWQPWLKYERRYVGPCLYLRCREQWVAHRPIRTEPESTVRWNHARLKELSAPLPGPIESIICQGCGYILMRHRDPGMQRATEGSGWALVSTELTLSSFFCDFSFTKKGYRKTLIVFF